MRLCGGAPTRAVIAWPACPGAQTTEAFPREHEPLMGISTTIPTLRYKWPEIRAYSAQEFPTYHDPFAMGARRFSAVITIESLPPAAAAHHRYAVEFGDREPSSAVDAVDRAMQFGKDILDETVSPDADCDRQSIHSSDTEQ
jgi:hypothetical protein